MDITDINIVLGEVFITFEFINYDDVIIEFHFERNSKIVRNVNSITFNKWNGYLEIVKVELNQQLVLNHCEDEIGGIKVRVNDPGGKLWEKLLNFGTKE